VNEYLINHAELTPSSPSAPIGLVVSSTFSYAAPLSYPSPILAALSVQSLGRSSVDYSVALFPALDIRTNGTGGRGSFGEGRKVGMELERVGEKPATWGVFRHVFVDPETGKSVEIPEGARIALNRLMRDGGE
jgi:acyl-CoA thioester hydrolase